MKKILTSLAILTMAGAIASPLLTNLSHVESDQSKIDNKEGYTPYQIKEEWENYMSKNQAFINIIRNVGGLSSDYQYKGSDLAMETITDSKTSISQPIGTLLMNGKIQTTVGSPSMASQHIIDNSQGSNPLTVNYDSKTVTTTSTVSASFSTDVSASVTASASFGLPFDNASISTTLSFDTKQSNSTTSSVEQQVTFDKFSTTVKPGDKEEVDYVVMQNRQVFNMVLKAKLNLSNCKFNFANSSNDTKAVAWSVLAKNLSDNQTFAQQVSNSLNSSEIAKNIQPLISFDKINDPTVPVESQFYDVNTSYIYLPLSFTIDGYSTLITQSKISN